MLFSSLGRLSKSRFLPCFQFSKIYWVISIIISKISQRLSKVKKTLKTLNLNNTYISGRVNDNPAFSPLVINTDFVPEIGKSAFLSICLS